MPKKLALLTDKLQAPKKDTKFKPGFSGNPKGQPMMPKEVREGRKLNQIEVAKLLTKFSALSAKDLVIIMNDPETKTLELMIGKIVAEAIKHGDQTRLNFILDRMIGKVKEVIEIDGSIEQHITVSRIDLVERIKILKGTS